MMKKWMKALIAVGLAFSVSMVNASGAVTYPLLNYPGELCDEASLQRGAGAFMQYCQGCHSLQYERYHGLAAGIGIKDIETGEVLEALVKDKLNFVTDKAHDPILSAIAKEDAEKWFGVVPPDLTLIARVRGTDWLYTYLHAFYEDASRPWGVNNALFPDVGMPHVLHTLQGSQEAVMRTVEVQAGGEVHTHEVIDHLQQKTEGALTPEAYDQLVVDLVNFLEYTAEPVKLERHRLGVWVMLFLVVFWLFAWLLKREYWKDVH